MQLRSSQSRVRDAGCLRQRYWAPRISHEIAILPSIYSFAKTIDRFTDDVHLRKRDRANRCQGVFFWFFLSTPKDIREYSHFGCKACNVGSRQSLSPSKLMYIIGLDKAISREACTVLLQACENDSSSYDSLRVAVVDYQSPYIVSDPSQYSKSSVCLGIRLLFNIFNMVERSFGIVEYSSNFSYDLLQRSQ